MSTSDPNLLAAMRAIEAAKKPDSSFRWTRDQPYPQPCHAFDAESGKWIPSSTSPTPSAAAEDSGSAVVTKIALITWNVDFMLPLASQRMSSALSHLHSLVETDPTTPTVVLLQEMLVSDLALIQAAPWVRERFCLTDIGDEFWESGYYGTVTLIDKRLRIRSAFRVHYAATKMERDVLVVDVELDAGGGGKGRVLRVCNTHLESLIAEPPLRPAQMAVAGRWMREAAARVHASVLAGDLNAIQPFDRTLHSENGLRDAYLELGGREDEEQGYTWGQQAQTRLRDIFGCSRMDKVFFWGGVEVVGLERVGKDVLVEGEGERERLVGLGMEKGWVTDHLGLRAEFRVVMRMGGEAEAEDAAKL